MARNDDLAANQPWYARLVALVNRGMSVPVAVDYMAVEDEGIPPEAWSKMRGTQTARAAKVSLRKAETVLADDQDADADQSSHE